MTENPYERTIPIRAKPSDIQKIRKLLPTEAGYTDAKRIQAFREIVELKAARPGIQILAFCFDHEINKNKN